MIQGALNRFHLPPRRGELERGVIIYKFDKVLLYQNLIKYTKRSYIIITGQETALGERKEAESCQTMRIGYVV